MPFSEPLGARRTYHMAAEPWNVAPIFRSGHLPRQLPMTVALRAAKTTLIKYVHVGAFFFSSLSPILLPHQRRPRLGHFSRGGKKNARYRQLQVSLRTRGITRKRAQAPPSEMAGWLKRRKNDRAGWVSRPEKETNRKTKSLKLGSGQRAVDPTPTSKPSRMPNKVTVPVDPSSSRAR